MGLDTDEVTYKDLANGLARIRLAMRRSDSVENRSNKIAYNNFGLIPFVLTRQIILNSRRLSTPCFAGTGMRLNVTSIYQIFRQLREKRTTSCLSLLGNLPFKKVDGLKEVGHSKSYLLQLCSNFSPDNSSDLVTKNL
jgi:hypothetical protein